MGFAGVQLDLLDAPAPLARRTDPSTSHAAADRARELAARHHRVILAALKKYGPMGKDALAARTNLTGVQVARRRSELARMGLARQTDKQVRSTAGRPEFAWEAV